MRMRKKMKGHYKVKKARYRTIPSELIEAQIHTPKADTAVKVKARVTGNEVKFHERKKITPSCIEATSEDNSASTDFK
jgi:hypothetical protein